MVAEVHSGDCSTHRLIPVSSSHPDLQQAKISNVTTFSHFSSSSTLPTLSQILHIMRLSHGEAPSTRETCKYRPRSTSRARVLFPWRGQHPQTQPHHPLRVPLSSPLPRRRPPLPISLNPTQRSRPQGRGDFGPDGSIFLTITHSYSAAPTQPEFQMKLASETVRDKGSANPLGRAMARVTQYPGNTLLQSGKFKRREGFVYIVKRPSGRREVVQSMERMKMEKTKGWWKDVREVWFNRGARCNLKYVFSSALLWMTNKPLGMTSVFEKTCRILNVMLCPMYAR
jgi:hypothetical protein